MEQLDPKAVWLFFIQYCTQWFIILFIGIFLIIFSSLSYSAPSDILGWLWIVILISIILIYGWARLNYHFYRYELTDTDFRKEFGVIYKKYVSIPYDRIQNVDIYRGLLARILGLSDVHIQTAGMSSPTGYYGGYDAISEGRLPGLSREKAEELRNELIKRARQPKNQGL